MNSSFQVAVIGSGTMGSGIAQVAATAGHKVFLIDANDTALEKAAKNHQQIFTRLIQKGTLTQTKATQIQSNIEYHIDLNAATSCQLVIEAIVENLEIKKNLFTELEKRLSADAILATNTSSLSIASISAACYKPNRVIGLHFFNPAPLLPLVEVVPSILTSTEVTNWCVNVMKQWGKTPVVAEDTPGFIVNRVARPFYGEALRIYEEQFGNIPKGEVGFATIDWAMKQFGGFKMGPFELMDLIGNDINYTVTETVFNAFYNDPRYKPSFTQKRMMEAGLLGRKSGKGYFNYATDSQPIKPIMDEKMGIIIFERILAMLINEAADATFWKIATEKDIDIAMTKGVNYPKGLLKWANDWGIQNVLSKIEELYNTYAEDRYRPSVILKQMAQNGKVFTL